MNNGRGGRPQWQVTMWDLLDDQDQARDDAAGAALLAANPKRWANLIPGDYVEVWWGNGLHWAGWVADAHPRRRAWEVEADWVDHGDGREPRGPWADQRVWGTRFMELAPEDEWRWVRYDAEYLLHPTEGEMVDWLADRLAEVAPSGSLGVHTEACALWPDGWEDKLDPLYDAALHLRWPDPRDYLADKRWTRYRLGKPERARVRALMALGPEARLDALRRLPVDESVQGAHGHLIVEDRSGAYDAYWMAHTADAAVLVGLVERQGRVYGRCIAEACDGEELVRHAEGGKV